MGKLPTSLLHRPRALLSSSSPHSTTLSRISPTLPSSSHSQHNTLGQIRHATFVPRPRRPYQFTQLVQLSDGSTFTVRTTMPQGLLKSTKDTRNHLIWQPSNKSLRNVEVDEAGKLAAFRERFGRGWDMEAKPEEGVEADAEAAVGAKDTKQPAEQKQQQAAPVEEEEDAFDSLTDLISSYATTSNNTKGGRTAKEQEKMDKKK